MKTKAIKLMIVTLLFSGVMFAQDLSSNQVPSVVFNTFKKEFPKANDVEWEMKGDRYNVEFEIGWFSDYEAWFKKSGELIRYEMDISKKDLPDAVRQSIKEQYKGYHVDDATKIVENNVETYAVEIEKGNDERDLIFSINGEQIKP
ncbi:MAG TPA: PepSY-like domain-containing protein [Flavobacteriaceae bacterium]|nr:PepSY-like domain-containing protein [Flavobacteriaceae bacterium]